MSRLIKEKMVREYGERFRDVSAVAVINAQGIDVKRMMTFRGVLRERGIQAMRIHNRLGRRAFASGTLKGIDALLDGPSTILWGGESIVDIAKVLKDEAKTLTELEIRGGLSDGEILSSEQIQALSELPGRKELIGLAVGKAIGQAARVVAAVMAMGGRLVAQMREISEQAPAEETPAEEEAEAAQPAAAEEPKTDDAAPDDESAADETPKQEVHEEQPKTDQTQDTDGAQEPPAPEQAPSDS